MKIKEFFEHIFYTIFSELFQAKAAIVVFGILALCCLVASFWNPFQLIISGMCTIIVLAGILEYKKVKRD